MCYLWRGQLLLFSWFAFCLCAVCHLCHLLLRFRHLQRGLASGHQWRTSFCGWCLLPTLKLQESCPASLTGRHIWTIPFTLCVRSLILRLGFGEVDFAASTRSQLLGVAEGIRVRLSRRFIFGLLSQDRVDVGVLPPLSSLSSHFHPLMQLRWIPDSLSLGYSLPLAFANWQDLVEGV